MLGDSTELVLESDPSLLERRMVQVLPSLLAQRMVQGLPLLLEHRMVEVMLLAIAWVLL
jgi:hypothetical protein